VKVTPDKDVWRYADFSFHPQHSHLIVSVLEDHTKPDPADVVNTLVTVNTQTKTVTPLVEGADFYSSPLISPDGKFISFVQWFHPDMPWEGGETVVAAISTTSDNSGLQINGERKVIAGKRGEVNSQQPEWISNDKIIVLADQSGFLIPYTYTLSTGSLAPVLNPGVEEEFGDPPWTYGNSSFAILDPTHVLLSSVKNNSSTLYLADLKSGTFKDLKSPYADVTLIHRVSSDSVVFKGKKLDEAEAVIRFTVSTGESKVLKQTSTIIETLPKGIISIPKSFSFFIPPKNEPVHCTYYPPRNPAYSENDNEKPPCVVYVHGGPTSRTGQGLAWTTQFFTSRGFGWLDVNYGGSTGYGRKYVDRLRGEWGVVDVDDTLECVRQIVKQGLVDEKRVVIRGGSAGGYTVLGALTRAPTFFAAGNSFFGVSDVRKLCEFTHKFESRYLERLIGGTPDENPQLYKDRSPIFHADKIRSPLLVLQGSIDKVVPPEQSKEMVEVVQKNKGVVKYVEYEGEGHGWRQASTIKSALEEELAWYRKTFGI